MNDDAGADAEGPESEQTDDAALADFREAAGAVIASLKQLVDAAERVVADPDAFATVVGGGRSIVEAFVSGLTGRPEPDENESPGAAES